jgi:ABC-2 type transport system permease protein
MSDTVIHDLGFRHYEGERLGRAWKFRSLLVETLRGIFGLGRPAKAKVMPWLLASFMIGPAAVSTIVLFVAGTGEHLFDYRIYSMNLAFIIALFVAARAPYAVSRDLRDGTMPLYLSRPVTYRDYVGAKLSGLTIATFVIQVVPVTVMMVTALLAKLPAGEQLGQWAASLMVALFVSLILSAIALAIAAATPRRGLGVAAIAATLLITFAIGLILIDPYGPTGDLAIAPFLGGVDPFQIVNGIAVAFFDSPGAEGIPTATGVGDGLIFLGLFALVVSTCVALLMRRYKKVGGA